MSRPVILNIDDSEDDALLFQRACRKAGAWFDLEIKQSGPDALAFLRSTPPGAPAFPALVLLDLNMPKMNGFEVLAQLQQMELLSRVPVCVFSSSENVRDVEKAYRTGALGYVTKPDSYEQLLQLVARLNAGIAAGFSPSWMSTLPGFKEPSLTV